MPDWSWQCFDCKKWNYDSATCVHCQESDEKEKNKEKGK